MDRPQQIINFFSGDRIKKICIEEFAPLKEQIIHNLQSKRTDSGKPVNSLNLPEETSGATASSFRTIAEQSASGLVVSFVGRKNIKNIDEGNSPEDAHEEFGSFDNFYKTIHQWARDKEARWGLPFKSINAYWAAKKIWEEGSILYRAGGGTEIMKDLLPPVVENIDRRLTEELDDTVHKYLESAIQI